VPSTLRAPAALSATGGSVAFALVNVLGALTFDRWADGEPREYAAAGILAVALGATSWACARLSRRSAGAATSLLAWGAALVVLLPIGIVHSQRVTHEVARTRQTTIADTFDRAGAPEPERWLVHREGAATLETHGDSVVLATPPGSIATLDLLLPGIPSPAGAEFWLPRGLYTDRFDEVLEWTGTARLNGQFSILLETRQLLVQVVPYGLHLTYPNERRQLTQHHVEHPGIAAGEPHAYRLERADGVIRLRVDDMSGWVQPDAGRFGLVRFGQTRAEAMHAGTLALEEVRYTRRFGERLVRG
jgi:hypothetical protein